MKLDAHLGYESLLTEQQAIDALGLGDRPNPNGAIKWLTRTKRLPYVRIGRGIVCFRPVDVAAFIERNHHGVEG